MKKSSIFIIIITFLASIFLVSFFGATVISEQFKTYIRSVEILTFTGKKSSGEKFYIVEYTEGDENYVQIDYNVVFSREGVSEEGLIEFAIITGNGTYEEDGELYEKAELRGLGNILYFNKPCAVTVELRTTAEDGSGCRDKCQFICLAKEND